MECILVATREDVIRLENLLSDEFLPKPAIQPTSAPPGSAEKIEVLRRRVENGEHLYHPEDRGQAARLMSYMQIRMDDDVTSHVVRYAERRNEKMQRRLAEPIASGKSKQDRPFLLSTCNVSVKEKELIQEMDIEQVLAADKLLREKSAEAIAAIDRKIGEHEKEISKLRDIRNRLSMREPITHESACRSPDNSNRKLPLPPHLAKHFSTFETKIISALKASGQQSMKPSEIASQIGLTAIEVGRVVSRSQMLAKVGSRICIAAN